MDPNCCFFTIRKPPLIQKVVLEVSYVRMDERQSTGRFRVIPDHAVELDWEHGKFDQSSDPSVDCSEAVQDGLPNCCQNASVVWLLSSSGMRIWKAALDSSSKNPCNVYDYATAVDMLSKFPSAIH